MPSPRKDEGRVMRMIRLGDILFAAVRAETRDIELANKFRGMRREAGARLLPYGIQISNSCCKGGNGIDNLKKLKM